MEKLGQTQQHRGTGGTGYTGAFDELGVAPMAGMDGRVHDLPRRESPGVSPARRKMPPRKVENDQQDSAKPEAED
jgi:hypothetical protein